MQASPFFSSLPARQGQPQQQQQPGQMPSGFIPTGSYGGPGTPSGMQQVQMPNGMVRAQVPNMVAPHPGMQQQMYGQAQARQQFVAPQQQQQQQGMVTPQRPTNGRVMTGAQTAPRRPGQGAWMQTPQGETQGMRTPVTDMKRSISFNSDGTPTGQVIPQTEPRRGNNSALQHGKTSPPPPPPTNMPRSGSGSFKGPKNDGVARTPSKPAAEVKVRLRTFSLLPHCIQRQPTPSRMRPLLFCRGVRRGWRGLPPQTRTPELDTQSGSYGGSPFGIPAKIRPAVCREVGASHVAHAGVRIWPRFSGEENASPWR